MKLNKALNEVQAEIVNGKIPLNKVFSNGNIVKLPDGSEWRRILGEVLSAINKAGLADDFKKDREPLDIDGSSTNGKVNVQSDSGQKYIYDINRKKLYKA